MKRKLFIFCACILLVASGCVIVEPHRYHHHYAVVEPVVPAPVVVVPR